MGEERETKGSTARKLKRRGVSAAIRGWTCTTPPPKWRLEETDKPSPEFLTCASSSPAISARKLCAHLWESEPLRYPGAKIAQRALGARRRPRRSDGLDGASKNMADQAEIAGTFHRAASASPRQCCRSSEMNDGFTLQPGCPASYGSSSSEVAPYKAVTPSSCVDSKPRMLGSSCGRKPPTEWIKVLNRIWRLEKENSMNVSLVKTLKIEVDQERGRIKELLLEKESERRDTDELVKQNVDRKLFSKRLRAAIESARDELEAERKLRKRSESLHQKLAREFSKLKSASENSLKELQRERKVRVLLENLCDEFAKGISENERELRKLHHKHGGADQHDRMILHISEAWLDERMQMKDSKGEHDIGEKITVVDKLGFDIATFLQSKQATEPKSRRFSLESLALNEAGSAPRNLAGEDSSECNSRRLETVKQKARSQTLIKAEIVDGRAEDLKSETRIKSESKPQSSCREGSCISKSLGNASPVSVWKSKLATPVFEESKASSRWPRELNENSLMAQLMEARLEKRRRSQARSSI